MRRTAVSIVAALALLAVLPGSSGARPVHPDAPFITSEPPMLVALQPGVAFTPIINAGELIGGRLGGFQFTGVPDGIGVYESSGNRLEVFVNHEMAYQWGDPSNARVSHLSLNPQGEIVGASYAVDGTEGYEYFCSSTMDTIAGVPWYFTGEEWIGSPKGGMSIAINGLTGQVIETPQFGALNHENNVPVKGLSQAVMYLSEDSFRLRSQAYSYFADTFTKALRGRGAFTVWVPKDQGDGDPSANDITKGDVLDGRFVTIPHAERYDGLELNRVAESLGSFNFVRIEDAAPDPSDPGVVYLSDTGANKADTKHGRIYKLTYDPVHPRRASLEVVLDGDDGDDIVNPDNLGISDQALVIQEDRNDTSSGYARIHTYDLSSGTLTAVARLDPSDRAIEAGGGPGVWESSGAVDVSDMFGAGYWLLDVQAHKTKVRQQGIDLKVDSAVGQRGQLLLVYLPGT
ncbi:MAG: hypothetical protein ACXWFT_05325 [Actinomycetota bacterium]